MSQTRVNATTADAIRDRYGTFFANAFAPQLRYEQMPGADERTAYAAEFVAYRLGQIDDKLGRLIEIMERETAQSASAGK
jgi:transcriptional regulator GlxA family with amidase domain